MRSEFLLPSDVSNQLDELRAVLAEIRATCVDCHQAMVLADIADIQLKFIVNSLSDRGWTGYFAAQCLNLCLEATK